jgi:hypothetical protein
MSFVIRSSNGQRSLTKVTNKDQQQNRTAAMQADLIEALRGLTIKFEIKIADIVQTPTGQNQATPDQAATTDSVAAAAAAAGQATFANRAGDILSELKTKLVSEQQQQHHQQQATASNGHRHSAESVREHQQYQQPAPVKAEPPPPVTEERPAQPPAGPSPTTSTIRPSTSGIRPVINRQRPPDADDSAPIKNEEVVVREPPKHAAPSAQPEVVAPKQEPKSEPLEPKTLDKPASAPLRISKSVPPASTTLVKGSLKIGSTLRTCCIWADDSKTPPVPYISYDSNRLTEITSMITDMAMSIESQQLVNSIDVGDIVFAKSKDDNAWYRAIVESVGVEDCTVYLFDWGLTETLDLTRIRRLAVLELGLSKQPAVALKIKINNEPGALVDRFLECETLFDIRVDSYDDFDETYSITILREHNDS